MVTPLAQHSNNLKRGITLKLISVFLFGLMGLQIKLLHDTYPTSEIVFFRTFFAIFPLLPLIIIAGGLSILKVKSVRMMSIRNSVGIAAMLLTFYSLPHVPLATFTTIMFTIPLFVAVLAALFINEKLLRGRLIAVLLGFTGVLVVLRPDVSGLDYFSLIALLAAFFLAIIAILVRQLTATENSIAIVFWFTASCATLTALVCLTEFKQPSLYDGLLLIGSGLAGGAGQVLLTQSYRYGQVSTLTSFEYTGLIWATLFEIYFWNKWPDSYVFLGASIIIGSGLYLLFHTTREQKKVR